MRERGGFRTARLCAEWKNDGEFIEDYGGIFDEHGIGESGLGGERNDAGAESFEKLFIGAVLRTSDMQVDRLARNEA